MTFAPKPWPSIKCLIISQRCAYYPSHIRFESRLYLGALHVYLAQPLGNRLS